MAWFLINVKEITDIGKNESIRILLQDPPFRANKEEWDNFIRKYGIPFHPATHEDVDKRLNEIFE